MRGASSPLQRRHMADTTWFLNPRHSAAFLGMLATFKLSYPLTRISRFSLLYASSLFLLDDDPDVALPLLLSGFEPPGLPPPPPGSDEDDDDELGSPFPEFDLAEGDRLIRSSNLATSDLISFMADSTFWDSLEAWCCLGRFPFELPSPWTTDPKGIMPPGLAEPEGCTPRSFWWVVSWANSLPTRGSGSIADDSCILWPICTCTWTLTKPRARWRPVGWVSWELEWICKIYFKFKTVSSS